MDKDTLKKVVQALKWEADYRSRFKQNKERAGRFLTIEGLIDPDFAPFFLNPDIAGSTVLDVGTGTGEQAIYLAKKGFKVTATDASATVINYAIQQAQHQQASVKFIQDDILFTSLNTQFDVIIDRGCYTLISPQNNSEYFANIKSLLKPNGWFLIKADLPKKKKIDALLTNSYFQIEFSKKTCYTTLNEETVPALFLIMKSKKV